MKRLRLIAIVMAIVLLGWLVIQLLRTKEPSYQGRTLTEWLQTGEKGEWVRPNSPHYYPLVTKSVAPVKAIGTNGIATFLRLIQAHDSKLKRFIRSLHDRQSLIDLRFLPDWEKQNMGIRGFMILGTNAISAVPALLQLMHDGNGDAAFGASYVLFGVLESFQRNKDICLPVLLKLLNDSDRDNQLSAANCMNAWFPGEAKKAGVYKKFPQLKPSNTSDIQINPERLRK